MDIRKLRIDLIRSKPYFWKLPLFSILTVLYLIHPANPLGALAETLTGQGPNTDIAQDYYGFRAIVNHWDTYPPLSYIYQQIGIDWGLSHKSTHPPTAFLFTALIAPFSWRLASALWGWLMLGLIVTSLRLYRVPWWLCFLCLLWPPVTFSLGQLTPIWLFCIALAYRNQNKPNVSGIWIGIASLTKFFPALLLIPLLRKHKWSSLIGFTMVWGIVLSLIIIINPDVIPRYIESNIINTPFNVLRADNTAFLPTLTRFLNWPGLTAGIIFLVATAWFGMNNWHIWEYLSIALLPISWVYSLLPLLPGVLKKIDNPLAGIILLIPMISPSYGVIAPVAFLPVFILSGILLQNNDRS